MNKNKMNGIGAAVIALAMPMAASAATVAPCGVGSGLSCVAELGSAYMPSNSGGGDTEARVEMAVTDALSLLSTIDLTLLGKSDASYGASVSGQSGTWTAPDAVDYITVKAGNEGYIVIDAGGLMTGGWSTMGLLVGNGPNAGNQPGVSHISYWSDGSTTSTTPVPIPAAGFLLLAGLGGMAALRRKS